MVTGRIPYDRFLTGKPLKMFETACKYRSASLGQLMKASGVDADDLLDVLPLLSEEDQKEFLSVGGEFSRLMGEEKEPKK